MKKLFLWLPIVACFYGSLWRFGAGMPYVAIISSNPHPPEMARFWAAQYALYSKLLFWTGLSSAILLLASYLKLPKLR
jgi:hypothetical protein